MAYNPELFQARLNGFKGVFILAPDLEDRGIRIQYRPSQHKFFTDHNVLEIIKHSTSGRALLKNSDDSLYQIV